MQVAKWGNSLAVRLPAAVVQALSLNEGDEIQMDILGPRTLELRRTLTREEASARLDELSTPLPPGFRFNRQEANER